MPPLVAGAEDNREPTDYQTGQQHYTQSQLADWLARAEENAGILAAISPNAAEEAFVLQANVMQMCYTHPGLAANMITNPEHVRILLINLLVQQGLVHNMLQRTWLRCIQVPLPPLSPQQVQQLLTEGKGSQAVRMQGVCTSVSTISKQVYARQVRCLFCGSEGGQLAGQAVSCCIGGQQQPDMCQEDLSCRQYMPVQHIWLAALPGGTKADKPFRVEASSLLVQLSDDDLCSSVSIGDAVDIVGQAHFSPESSKAGNKLLGDVQVKANNVSRMHLSWLDPPSDPPQSKGHQRQLTALCDALQACLNCPLPQDIALALLLSAATAGVSATAPSQTNATAARNQVHVMLMTKGLDPVLMRTLFEAANNLSGLHAVHSPSLGPLLPEVVKLGGEDLSLQQQPVRVLGGSLASNNKGILLLSTNDVKKAERETLGAALSKGCFELKQASSLHIPATAAVWAVHSGDSAGRGKIGISTGHAESARQMMTQGAAQDMGHSFLTAFDLTLACDHGGIMTEDYMDSILSRQASKEASSSNVTGQGTSSCDSSSSGSSSRKAVRQRLRQTIHKAADLPLPCISPDAMMMIQQYYALLRQQCHGQAHTALNVGSHTVAGLLCMASASARLRGQNDVEAMPDAVLAIYMLQLSLKAKGMSIVEQLDVYTFGRECCTQTTQDMDTSIEAKLRRVHDFMSDYMISTAIEE